MFSRQPNTSLPMDFPPRATAAPILPEPRSRLKVDARTEYARDPKLTKIILLHRGSKSQCLTGINPDSGSDEVNVFFTTAE